VRVPALNVQIDAEVQVRATPSQGKSRLRKDDRNNRRKLHLVPLVMALARLPVPVREDRIGTVTWPLENRQFIVSEMDFDVLSDDGHVAILEPLTARILHSERSIDLRHRFSLINDDISLVPTVAADHPPLARALDDTNKLLASGINSIDLRHAADEIIDLQTGIYGKTNSATITTIVNLPPSYLEDDIKGTEGKILTRLHAYRERNRTLIVRAKRAFFHKHRRLFCECCGFDYAHFYGGRGKFVIEAHHKIPVEQLLPDTETTADDLAMVCGSCHGIIHNKRPWISVDDLRTELLNRGTAFA
jgi:hypothetical protein